MDKERQQKIYELLKRGLKFVENSEELPAEWAREFYPPERREYELGYYGKKSEEQILADTMAVPFQPVSTFGKNGVDWHNKLIFGDNLQVMKMLLQMKEHNELVNADGTPGVRLVYIDPPFATKKEFRGSQDQKAYQDKIAGADFLEFLRERLVLLKNLLSNDGSIYVHLDWKKGHYVKVLMDEIFGENHFVNEIVWKKYSGVKNQASKKLTTQTESIFLYSRNSALTFNQQYRPMSDEYVEAEYKYTDENGRKYALLRGRGYANEKKTKKKYLDENLGSPITSLWDDDGLQLNTSTSERIGYPTQKPESLIERIIKFSSNEGDIVLDAFAGSGTTCAVAEKLKRRWIAIDCGKLAIYTIQKRMLNLKEEIGNSGKSLAIKPFTLYNAGLYDFETLRKLPWEGWRSIALQLFECKDEPHTIRGFNLDGKRQGASVVVFNYFDKGDIGYETIEDIHHTIGKQVGNRCFIIAPRGVFLFQEDYV